jgi:hypothetical protein
VTTVYQQLFTGANFNPVPDFTPVEGTCTIQNNAGETLTPASSFQRAKMHYDVPGIPQDFVLTIDCLIFAAGATTDWYLELAIRGGSVSYNNQWIFNSWQIQYNPSISGPQLYNVNGAGTNGFLASFTDPLCAVGDTLHLKIAPVGNQYRIKSWKNAGSEPATFETFVDTGTVPSGTRVMLGGVQGGSASPAFAPRWDNLLIDDASGVSRASSTPVGAHASAVTSASINPAPGPTPRLMRV